METRELTEDLKRTIIKKIFVFLVLALGGPTLGLEIYFALWNLRTTGNFKEILRNPTIPIEDQLPQILDILNTDLSRNIFGWLLQLLVIMIAYYGCVDIWVRAYRAQEIPPLWQIWFDSIRFSLTRGSLAFILLLCFAGPIQLWSLFLGGYFFLIVTITVGSLLLMAPVILKVNPSIGFLRVIPYALFVKYSRPPILERTRVATIITNLSLLYMIAYGFFGLSILGDKIFMNNDSLPTWLHALAYEPTPYFFYLTPAYFLAHLWSITIKMVLITFLTFTSVYLYFSISERKKIAKI
jgi:hypothetical protein